MISETNLGEYRLKAQSRLLSYVLILSGYRRFELDNQGRTTIVWPVRKMAFFGFDHRFGHARGFFPARQELAVAQTACRSYKNTLA
jgi:hypothetical protein